MVSSLIKTTDSSSLLLLNSTSVQKYILKNRQTLRFLNGSILTHEPSRVGDVGADLAVDLDEPLHADLLHLISGQGVLEAVPQEDDEGQALPQLVGTGGRTRSLKNNHVLDDEEGRSFL